MTRLYLHSTDPEVASKMKPEVYAKILKRREELTATLQQIETDAHTISLEIGCGHGHFLTAMALKTPKEQFVGIDVNRGRIFKARRKAERLGLKNIHLLECESIEFLKLLPDKIRIKETWILYPDPWPKKRHFKNRIIQAPFLDALASASILKGKLFLRSDYDAYLEWSKELLDQSGEWTVLPNFEWPEITATVFQELTNNQHSSLVAELNPLKE
tara:strand:+ start:6974 stop:7618 length:645 start_codon:yes stop_codon:yes gene_type:complete